MYKSWRYNLAFIFSILRTSVNNVKPTNALFSLVLKLSPKYGNKLSNTTPAPLKYLPDSSSNPYWLLITTPFFPFEEYSINSSPLSWWSIHSTLQPASTKLLISEWFIKKSTQKIFFPLTLSTGIKKPCFLSLFIYQLNFIPFLCRD